MSTKTVQRIGHVLVEIPKKVMKQFVMVAPLKNVVFKAPVE